MKCLVLYYVYVVGMIFDWTFENVKSQLFVWLSFVVDDVVDKFRYYSIMTVSLMNRFKGYIRRKHVKM